MTRPGSWLTRRAVGIGNVKGQGLSQEPFPTQRIPPSLVPVLCQSRESSSSPVVVRCLSPTLLIQNVGHATGYIKPEFLKYCERSRYRERSSCNVPALSLVSCASTTVQIGFEASAIKALSSGTPFLRLHPCEYSDIRLPP